jgi:hypothetical protein
MRLPRFRGLPRRLSYANVIATLALFFALTGTATAVGKYLTTSDPIIQGDLAGSTYGNPVIADGKITTAKFNASAVAPDSQKLGGHPASAFAAVVARGTISLSGNVAGHSCLDDGEDLPTGVDPTTDWIVIQPAQDHALGLTAEGRFDQPLGAQQVFLVLSVCNPSDGEQPASADYRYLILR